MLVEFDLRPFACSLEDPRVLPLSLGCCFLYPIFIPPSPSRLSTVFFVLFRCILTGSFELCSCLHYVSFLAMLACVLWFLCLSPATVFWSIKPANLRIYWVITIIIISRSRGLLSSRIGTSGGSLDSPVRQAVKGRPNRRTEEKKEDLKEREDSFIPLQIQLQFNFLFFYFFFLLQLLSISNTRPLPISLSLPGSLLVLSRPLPTPPSPS